MKIRRKNQNTNQFITETNIFHFHFCPLPGAPCLARFVYWYLFSRARGKNAASELVTIYSFRVSLVIFNSPRLLPRRRFRLFFAPHFYGLRETHDSMNSARREI